MKKGRQLAHHFFYNVSFIKKMVFLFCIGVVIPMIFLQAVSYLETERGIKERMLKTVNEALDDKTFKIRSVLSETAALENAIRQMRRCISVWIRIIRRILIT